MELGHEGGGELVDLSRGVIHHVGEGGGPEERAGGGFVKGGLRADHVADLDHLGVGGKGGGNAEEFKPVLPGGEGFFVIAGGDLHDLEGVAVDHAHGEHGLDAEALARSMAAGLLETMVWVSTKG